MNKLMNRAGLLAASFALALAVALALNAATQTTEVAEAQTPIGTDTDGDGLTEIKNYDQLNAMRYDMNGDGIPNYDLNNDGIRDDGIPPNAYSTHLSCPAPCNGYELGDNISLVGRGDWGLPGLGTVFNGNGFTITGLSGKQGLFNGIGPDGVVKNVNVVKASITKGPYDGVTAGVISASNNGTIIGVYASGHLTVGSSKTNGSVGGLVGRNYGPIVASVADVDVKVTDIPIDDNGKPRAVRVGAFVGMNYDHIHGSYAYGDVIDGRVDASLPDGEPVGFRAYGFGINHTGNGGEIHWSFSYGKRNIRGTESPAESPAPFAHGSSNGRTELITKSCELDSESKFTFDDCD